jgi:hypothetical protein
MHGEQMTLADDFDERMLEYERVRAERKARMVLIIKEARAIVTEGRRELARVHHPDHGGSQETMAEVNAAKELLDKFIDEYEKEGFS